MNNLLGAIFISFFNFFTIINNLIYFLLCHHIVWLYWVLLSLNNFSWFYLYEFKFILFLFSITFRLPFILVPDFWIGHKYWHQSILIFLLKLGWYIWWVRILWIAVFLNIFQIFFTRTFSIVGHWFKLNHMLASGGNSSQLIRL